MDLNDKKIIEELLDKQSDRYEKRMDARFIEQSDRYERRMIQVFNEGFDQVILPHIVEINENIVSMKQDISSLDKRLTNVEHSQDRMERKLNSVVDRQDEQGLEIKKIKKFVKMPESV
ncbi:hypothetical protein AUK11_03320 [bacterium CG2_30_37_16]|nr:MAG: hypothetical protein AUK11_03320 [bacterium CG2_30_37_16]PIP30345.1 MAG: hypothetical protein COX25_05160 [bacterium (Candidatus Howlettbacteria) CG23_combo_of_CG06-09_8_20_14_all_37_9]